MAKRAFLSIVALCLFCLPLTALVPKAQAADAINWSDGRIIDDFVFTNKNDMTPDQIQVFLNQKVGTGGSAYSTPGFCDTQGVRTSEFGGGTRVQYAASTGRSIPFTCLKDYYEVPKLDPSPGTPANNYGGKPIPAGARSAAEMIWDASQRYSINPKVLLVTIQKESAGPLTTDDWPFESQYTYAMGAHCPDSGPGGSANCDSNYAGFSIQIYESARLFRYYLNNMYQPWWTYAKPGVRNILYNVSAKQSVCGSKSVNILTEATAALYTYTPYVPNQAALNNLYGSVPGDSTNPNDWNAYCAAYGNRNFWRIFVDWFGTTYANDTNQPHPNGTLVSGNGKVWLISNNQKKHVQTPNIFKSYNYQWDRVKPATTGDLALPTGPSIDSLAEGTLFRSDNTPVYVMKIDGGYLKKQPVSYNAFMSLGYKWDEVMYVPPNEVTNLTASGLLDTALHPNGTVISNSTEGKVYRLDSGTKRHVLGPVAFNSNNLDWNKVKTATALDNALPVGAPLDVAQGTMLNANGIYLIDYDNSGIVKRPVGPWECYIDRLHYTPNDWTYVLISSLPPRTGGIYTC